MTKKTNINFEELLYKNNGIINKICCIYADSTENRKDLRQEIYLQLWRSYENFRGDSSVSTWLYKVSLNTAITFFKKEKKQSGKVNECIGDHNNSNKIDEKENEQLERMYSAISTLNKLEKAVVTLYLDNKPYSEISEVLGITPGNARIRILRIKEKLKKMLNEH